MNPNDQRILDDLQGLRAGGRGANVRLLSERTGIPHSTADEAVKRLEAKGLAVYDQFPGEWSAKG